VYVYKNVYPNSIMHFSKLNYFHGEERGAICVRQTRTTTSWHNKHPLMKWVTRRSNIGPLGKPIIVF
jgi:hypothetical protein